MQGSSSKALFIALLVHNMTIKANVTLGETLYFIL